MSDLQIPSDCSEDDIDNLKLNDAIASLGLSSDAIDNLPQNVKIELLRVVEKSEYIGPIPLASEIAGYEKVCKGAANRIILMAEKQSDHRQNLETKLAEASINATKTDQSNEFRLSLLGSIFAFIIAIVVLLIGLYCIINGYEVVGLIALISSLAALVSVFFGSKNQKDEKGE